MRFAARRLDILTEPEIKAIVDFALGILDEVGMRIENARMCERLAEGVTGTLGQKAIVHFPGDWQYGLLTATGYQMEYTAAWWTPYALEKLDDAIRLLHEINGTDTLIQKADGAYVTLTRCDRYGNEFTANFKGDIYVFGPNDSVWGLSDLFGRTVVQAFAQNWDTEYGHSNGFFALSGWTQEWHAYESGWAGETWGDEIWWYLEDSEFFGEAGRLSPYADWATCVGAYFYGGDPDDPSGSVDPDHAWMADNMPDKFDWLDTFLRTYHG